MRFWLNFVRNNHLYWSLNASWGSNLDPELDRGPNLDLAAVRSLDPVAAFAAVGLEDQPEAVGDIAGRHLIIFISNKQKLIFLTTQLQSNLF